MLTFTDNLLIISRTVGCLCFTCEMMEVKMKQTVK